MWGNEPSRLCGFRMSHGIGVNCECNHPSSQDCDCLCHRCPYCDCPFGNEVECQFCGEIVAPENGPDWDEIIDPHMP